MSDTDDQPTVVEFTDGTTGILPSVTEYQRMAEQNERDWQEMRQHPILDAVFSFDLSAD